MTNSFDIGLLFKLIAITAVVGFACYWVGTNYFPTEFAQIQLFFDQNGIDTGFDYDSFARGADHEILDRKNDAAVWVDRNSR